MPKVFISYSHDSPAHMDRVLALSNRLRAEGVDCEIDQYQDSPAEGWPKWMDRQIINADFILVVCTENYFRRVMGTEEQGKGLGVRWESTLTYQHLYNAGADNKKFIPILFDPNDSQYICTPLQGATYYILEQGYEDLYRRLTNQPKHVKPELGKLKTLPVKVRKQGFFALHVSLAKPPTTSPVLFDKEKKHTINKPTIFISYSHKDNEWKERLVTQLGVLEKQGLLETWDDQKIGAGDDWREQIEQALNSAHITILMITANFLTSDFILNEEVPLLLERRQKEGVRVIPLIIKPCAWKTIPWLRAINARPKDGRPLSGGSEYQIDADLASLAEEIEKLIHPAAAATTGKFVPLPPDQVSLAKLPATGKDLFGREECLKRIDEAWSDPHTHILCLVAFGGVGKTALVNEWLNRFGADNWRGAERVYGWSFYSQGTREDKQASADTFFEETLRFFGCTGELPKSPWDKGKLLATLIKERRTLLFLDGLEPLQYPPGEMEGGLRD